MDTSRVAVSGGESIFVTKDSDDHTIWLAVVADGRSVEIPLETRDVQDLIAALKEVS